MEIQNWPHRAEVGTIHEVEGNEETSIQFYTDGSKQEQGVGSGAVIFKGSEMIAKLQFKLDNRCSKNQAEQLAILKALEKLEVLSRQSINPIWATIFTDSGLLWTRFKTTKTTVSWWKKLEKRLLVWREADGK